MSKRYFSAPGRVEICGNHTDHQRGRVLTAAIDLHTKCVAETNGTDIAQISYRHYGGNTVDLRDLRVRKSEKGRPSALVRGVAAWFKERGHEIAGFDAEVSSNVPIGSGLSSSAAFEVLIGNVMNHLFALGVSPLDIALAGQFAENVYFGKPCGLMDQSASSFGGLIMIDFADVNAPIITPVRAELPGYALCVVDTGGSHADLTPDYAAIPGEMKAVAAHFGKEHLREVPCEEFYAEIKKMRHLGDRAILRAIHFFGDNERVVKQADALNSGDLPTFLSLVNESGRSSLNYLQNVFSSINPHKQGLTLALALSERILAKKGAWRVHGGGFAGTILAFVPDGLKTEYETAMSNVFGDRCCHFLNICEKGGMEIT